MRNLKAVGLVARGGCSRWRGGQGTRVPVSQLCPQHQLPHSSCCSARAPQPSTALGAFVPCVLPLSLTPSRPCSSPAARGWLFVPRLGPAALVPTARADKEALEGLGTAGKGPAQARGHGRDTAENQGTVARPGMGTVPLGMGTGMGTVSLRMGTRAWLAGNGGQSVTRDGNNGDRDRGVAGDNRELGQRPDRAGLGYH